MQHCIVCGECLAVSSQAAWLRLESLCVSETLEQVPIPTRPVQAKCPSRLARCRPGARASMRSRGSACGHQSSEDAAEEGDRQRPLISAHSACLYRQGGAGWARELHLTVHVLHMTEFSIEPQDVESVIVK